MDFCLRNFRIVSSLALLLVASSQMVLVLPYTQFDTVRLRMMMTYGEAVKYKSSFYAFNQILESEGAKSLFKGAGANILRVVAGVLAGYDNF